MGAITVKFQQAPNFKKDLGVMSGAMVLRLAMQVETKAKGRCPVKTGNLRRSITSAMAVIDGIPTGVVAATAHYAGFVELGTKYQNPQPFLRPALLDVIK